MEIVAMDMKLRGMYIARQLSFHGVTFKIEEVGLTSEFKKIYDDSVALVIFLQSSSVFFNIILFSVTMFSGSKQCKNSQKPLN